MTARPYRWVVLAAGTAAFSTSYLVRQSHTGIGKSLQQDLHLDKAEYGLLGSAFFYAYAVGQIPWGTLTDRFGGRLTVAGGTLLTGLAIAFFAFVQDLTGAAGTRIAAGLFSASVFVPMAAVCACWFPSRERGVANSLYHGVGGGAGQLIAYSMMPWLAAHPQFHVAGVSGWRGTILVIAAFILGAGLIAAVFMRSRPTEPVEAEAGPPTEAVSYQKEMRAVFRDHRLWLLAGVFISFTMTIRLVHGWIQIYAADLLIARRGMSIEQAQVSAAVVGICMVVGQMVGEPWYGRVSDAALQRGIARGWMMAASLAAKVVAFFVLMVPVANPWFYAAIGFVIGAVGNSAPVVSAAASEFFGARVAGFAMGVVNTIGQFMGAFVLTLSGWVAINLSKEPGNAIAEYQPIWWLGIGCSTVGIVSAVRLGMMGRRTTG